MEDRDPPEGWGRTFRSLVTSAPEDADLLAAESWTFSNRVHLAPQWLKAENPGWLEGNVLVAPDGKLVNVLHSVNRTAHQALCRCIRRCAVRGDRTSNGPGRLDGRRGGSGC